jgi:hypothetical protein
MAQRFAAQGLESARVPVFAFEDWRRVFNRPAEGSALAAFREQQRRTFYLLHFLRRQGVEPEPVPVAAGEFLAWAEESGHELGDGHAIAHAVGEYVNQPAAPVAQCRHGGVPAEVLAALGPGLATITALGESPEEPEVLVAVVHLADGSVLNQLQLLAVEHSPQEAWQHIEDFLDSHKLERVFHDRQVRRPEFCPDCGYLLSQVASAQDIQAAGLAPAAESGPEA